MRPGYKNYIVLASILGLGFVPIRISSAQGTLPPEPQEKTTPSSLTTSADAVNQEMPPLSQIQTAPNTFVDKTPNRTSPAGELGIAPVSDNTPLTEPQDRKEQNTAAPQATASNGNSVQGTASPTETLFDDTLLLRGYTDKYLQNSLETLMEMIKDDTLSPYHMAAAVRAFKEKYSLEIFSREKAAIEKILLRRLARTNSVFVQVEILHTLCLMDRFKYFEVMIPSLIQLLDHYNDTVNEMTNTAINDIINRGNNRAREARIVFNTLRKVFFLSRRRLVGVTEPSLRLSQKLKMLRWSIKVLGSQELKKLPKEVINLL